MFCVTVNNDHVMCMHEDRVYSVGVVNNGVAPDLIIENQNIIQHFIHAYLSKYGETLSVMDNYSFFGTRINGLEIPTGVMIPVVDGDLLQFGVVDIMYEVVEQRLISTPVSTRTHLQESQDDEGLQKKICSITTKN